MGTIYHKHLTGADLHNPKSHVSSHESGGNDAIDLSKVLFASELMVSNNYYDAIIEAFNNGGGGSSVWGSITGTITNQTDLVNLLATKEAVLTFSIGLTRTGNTIVVKDSEIDHNSLSNYDSDRHFLQADIIEISDSITNGILVTTDGELSSITNNSSNWDSAYSLKTSLDALNGVIKGDGAGNYSVQSLVTTFLGLSDTPSSFFGTSLKGVRVNVGETGLEFYTVVDTDEKVKIDSEATAGYLGSAYNDGVLRTSSPLTFSDGGNFVTLGINKASNILDGYLSKEDWLIFNNKTELRIDNEYNCLVGGE